VLHRPLEAFLDPGSALVEANRAGGHALVQPDHEHVQGDPDRDHPHSSKWQIDEAEREQECVGEHQETEAETVDQVGWQVDQVESDLDEQSCQKEAAASDRELHQPGPAPAGHDDHDHRSENRDGEQPHLPPPYRTSHRLRCRLGR